MNIVRRGTALAAFGVATILLVPMGCEEKIEPVDCPTFCDKEASCYAEVAEALDVKGREAIAKADAKMLKVVADKHRERCMTSCNDPNKPKLIDKKWNECLKIDACQPFADCVYKKK